MEGDTPEAILHIGAGSIALLTGVLAVFSRKGARIHRTAGAVFVAALLATAGSGVYLGFVGENINNAIAGIVAIYLITTSWATIRRGERKTGAFEIAAFVFAAAGAAFAFAAAFSAARAGTAMFGGIPYFTISSIIALAAFLDLSVILRGGVAGKERVARHLWRMLLGFSAAVGSFFPGQLEYFPEYIQKIRPFILLFIPFFLVVGLMAFWLVRVLFTNWHSVHVASKVASTK